MINKINSSSGPCIYISCETLITCEIPIPHTIPRTIPGGIPGGIPGWIPHCCGRASWIVPKSFRNHHQIMYANFNNFGQIFPALKKGRG